MASARQVVPRDSALHRADLPWSRGDRVRDHRVVRDPLHRPLPERALRLRRRGHALDNRVSAYAFVLVTDQYPPFQPEPARAEEPSRDGADSARRASSSILPCAASSLPTHELVELLAALPQLIASSRPASPRSSRSTICSSSRCASSKVGSVSHSTRAPKRPSATSTSTSSPVGRRRRRTISSPARTIA